MLAQVRNEARFEKLLAEVNLHKTKIYPAGTKHHMLIFGTILVAMSGDQNLVSIQVLGPDLLTAYASTKRLLMLK